MAEKRHTYIRLTDRNTDLRLVPPDEIQSIHVNNELEPVDMPMGKIFRLKMEGDPFGYRTIHPVFFGNYNELFFQPIRAVREGFLPIIGTLDDKLRWLKDNGTFYAAYLSNTPKGTWFTCLLWHQKDSTDLLLHKDLQPRDENTRAKKKAGAISRPQNQLRPALAMVVDKKGYVKYTLVQNLLALALFQQSNKHVKTFT